MSTPTNLREWQNDHLKKALQRYDSHMQSTAEVKNIFLSEAVTGAGKTTLAVAVYAALINAGYIDGCVIVCPKGNICDGWVEAFTRAKINVSKDHNPKSDVKVVVITYAGIAGKYLSGRNAVRFPSRYLLILDEIHHAEREETWGRDASSLAEKALLILALTGTPWIAGGKIAILERNGYYQPRKNSKGKDLKTEDVVADASYSYAHDLGLFPHKDAERATVPIEFQFIAGEAKTRVTTDGIVDYETYVLEPVTKENKHEIKDRTGPLVPPLQPFVDIDCSELEAAKLPRELLNAAAAGLKEVRESAAYAKSDRKPMGLVTCKSIREAHYAAAYLTNVLGQPAEVIATKKERDGDFIVNDSADDRIKEIRAGKNPPMWVVSVALVSEGVDLPWIKVIAYLNQITTLLFLVQLIGRAIRRIAKRRSPEGVTEYFDDGDINATRARMYLPAHPSLVKICDEIERLIPPGILERSGNPDVEPPRTIFNTVGSDPVGDGHCVYRGQDMDIGLRRLITSVEADPIAMQELGTHWLAMILDWVGRGQVERANEELEAQIARFAVEVREPMDVDEDGVGMDYDTRAKLVSDDVKMEVAYIREVHPKFKNVLDTANPNAYQLVRREICQRLYGHFREFPTLDLVEKKRYFREAKKLRFEADDLVRAASRAAE